MGSTFSYNTKKVVTMGHFVARLEGRLKLIKKNLFGLVFDPRLITYQKFFLRSYKIGTVIGPNDQWSAITGDDAFDCYFAWSRVH